MNFEDARAAIYARLDTAWTAAHPTVPALYENRLAVDLAGRTDPFIACEILFNDGEQVSMEKTPVLRFFGAIYLSVWVKEKEGTKIALTYLGELSDLFKAASFGGVNTRAPRPLPGRPQDSWYVSTLRVPFWFDQGA